MAEARSSFDRSQLKANDNIHGRSPSVSYFGSLVTRRMFRQQRRRRAHLHVEQQPGVSLGRAFGIRSLHGHRTGFICRLSGHIENMFACSGLSLRNIDFELLQLKHDQQKITKTSPLERERTLDIRRYFGEGLLVFCFYFPYQNAAECAVAFGPLRVCFACGEVIMIEAVACEWWQHD